MGGRTDRLASRGASTEGLIIWCKFHTTGCISHPGSMAWDVRPARQRARWELAFTGARAEDRGPARPEPAASCNLQGRECQLLTVNIHKNYCSIQDPTVTSLSCSQSFILNQEIVHKTIKVKSFTVTGRLNILFFWKGLPHAGSDYTSFTYFFCSSCVFPRKYQYSLLFLNIYLNVHHTCTTHVPKHMKLNRQTVECWWKWL